MGSLRKFEPGISVDERISRLESHVEHILSHISDMKSDLRKMDGKIDTVKESVEGKVDTVRESMAALAVRVEQGFANASEKFDRKLAWVIGLLLTFAAGSASGFLWLADKINEL